MLRAESSLNSLVSHPLPAQFYDGGGMQALREKFRQEKKSSRGGDLDGEVVEEIVPEESKGRASYFTSIPGARDRRSSGSFGQATSSGNINSLNLAVDSINTSPIFNTAPLPTPSSHPPTPAVAPSVSRPLRPLAPPSPQNISRTPTAMAPGFRRGNTRKHVQAGDLLSMTDSGETAYRPQSFAAVTPRPLAWDQPRRSTVTTQQPLATSMEHALPDFNLRDAVMESLAKSIGLIQPPPFLPNSASASTYATSINGSTMLHSPSSYTPFSQSASSYASFGAGLSMLERLGDEGSTTGGSGSGWAAGSGTGEAMEELENEVEILFFPKGGQLVKEGEKNAGQSDTPFSPACCFRF